MIANDRLISGALRACRAAGIPGDKPAADAAIAHCLAHPANKPPKTMRWAGRLWYLTAWGSGRVHVSGYPWREDGLVSGYGALL